MVFLRHLFRKDTSALEQNPDLVPALVEAKRTLQAAEHLLDEKDKIFTTVTLPFSSDNPSDADREAKFFLEREGYLFDFDGNPLLERKDKEAMQKGGLAVCNFPKQPKF